jgi:hypothetical protein
MFALGLWLMSPPLPADAQQRSDAQCTLCHGELELMRRHTATLDAARALVVTDLTLRRSA